MPKRRWLAYFNTRREQIPCRLLQPAMGGSVIGVAAGVALLGWLSGASLVLLRALLLVARGASSAASLNPRRFALVAACPGSLDRYGDRSFRHKQSIWTANELFRSSGEP